MNAPVYRRAPMAKTLMVAAAALAALVAASLVAVPMAEAKAKGKGKKGVVRVMTRNVYLGADLGPGLEAGNFAELSAGAGTIYRHVALNNFKLRAKQLAKEIRAANADVVGLQEVALWRENTPPILYVPGEGSVPESQKITYDFLALLLKELKGYKKVKVQNQFDFESPADTDGNPATCTLNPDDEGLCTVTPGADKTGRLTMRDVIIAKKKVKTSKSDSANFSEENLFTPLIAGVVPLPVTRGWTATTAKVPGAKPFRFVNVHLEAFGDPEEAKCNQAKELFPEAIDGNNLPVILAGDLNSDDDTVDGDPNTPELDGTGWDRCAYNYLVSEGMRSLTAGTAADNTCCLSGSLLEPRAASVARDQTDHQVDHLMTNSKRVVRFGKTKTTGVRPFRTATPAWGSDHQGVAQAVKIR